MDQAEEAAHWNAAYAQGDDTRSWLQQHPGMSLRMLDSAGASAVDALIDVGGGASPLTGALLDRKHLRIDQRMLGRLQIRPAEHAGQIGTSDLNKRRPEFGAECIFNRHPPVQGVVLTAPASQ